MAISNLCRALLILGSALAAAFPLMGQDVAGSVTCNDGNVPARGARVELVAIDSLLTEQKESPKRIEGTTDFSGAYEIPSVPPGNYVVRVALEGYEDDFELIHAYLDKFSLDEKKKLLGSLPTVTVRAGSSSRKDLIVRRAGSISGRITVDLGGVPGKVAVTAALVTPAEAAKPGPSNASLSRSTAVDDRGVYRIAGLPPGTYRVSVRITGAFFQPHVQPGDHVTLTATRPGTAELVVFAPEALAEASARMIKVGDGDEITDADITVPARLLHSISGVITDGGSPRVDIGITLQRPDGTTEPSGAISGNDGVYRFDLLPSGSYTLTARPVAEPASGVTVRTAKIIVQIQDNDATDANIELQQRSGH